MEGGHLLSVSVCLFTQLYLKFTLSSEIFYQLGSLAYLKQ